MATLIRTYTVAWQQWASTATITSISATAGTTCGCDPWAYWCAAGPTATTATITASTNGAWAEWAIHYVERQEQTAEEIAAAAARHAERAKRQRIEYEQWAVKDAELKAQREEAGRKALILLMAILNEQQRAEYQEKKHFHVTGQSGKRYRINEGVHGNIKLVDADGKVLKSLCVAPRASLPTPDHMAAQLLYLRHNEGELLRTANITNVAA